MRTSESNPDDWYQLAADRIRAADLLIAEPGISYAGVELLHEAVERYLKGYLISKGWALRRTHDLGQLLAEAVAYDPEFAAFGRLADNLTDQFWAQHYPGGDLTGVGIDITQMREEVGKLVALVLGSA